MEKRNYHEVAVRFPDAYEPVNAGRAAEIISRGRGYGGIRICTSKGRQRLRGLVSMGHMGLDPEFPGPLVFMKPGSAGEFACVQALPDRLMLKHFILSGVTLEDGGEWYTLLMTVLSLPWEWIARGNALDPEGIPFAQKAAELINFRVKAN